MSEAKEFVTRGPIIDPGKQIYIERPEDTKILDAVRNRHYVTILGARQTGKTSLLYKLSRELKTEISVFVDLSDFSGVEGIDWYDCVAKELVGYLPDENFKNEMRESSCANQAQFSLLLKRIVNAIDKDRIILMLDEMGTVPPEIRDHFFSTIRSIYNKRGFDKAFQKYVFVLAGTTSPEELISTESGNSPFNVSKRIYMGDFSLEGVRRLGENLEVHDFTIDGSVIEHIYDWTHGHPNLTQEIFARLVQANPGKVTEKMVDDLVDELVAEGCNNLNHILRYVKDEAVNQQVLGILNGELEIPFSLLNPEVLNLYLIGVIREGTEGKCVIRNEVYKEALQSIKMEYEIKTLEEEKESQTDKQLGRSTLTAKIISDDRIYFPLIAISRINPEFRTINRIKKEIDTLISKLKSEISDISQIPSNQKQLSSALDELVQLGVLDKDDELYILTKIGGKVLVEI